MHLRSYVGSKNEEKVRYASLSLVAHTLVTWLVGALTRQSVLIELVGLGITLHHKQ